jgi:hypothetical protein
LIKDLKYSSIVGISNEEELTALLNKYEIKTITAKSIIELFEKSNAFNHRYGLVSESLFEEI